MMQLLSWVQSNIFLKISLLLIVLYILNNFLIYSLAKISKYYYLILMPGVILHELSHIVACLLTGAKIRSFKLFSEKGGYVVHEKSKLPIFGQAIISIFPLIIATIALVLITVKIPDSSIQAKIILYYLSISIILTMLPSKADIINSLISLPILILFVYYMVTRLKISQIYVFEEMLRGSILVVIVSIVVINTTRQIWKLR